MPPVDALLLASRPEAHSQVSRMSPVEFLKKYSESYMETADMMVSIYGWATGKVIRVAGAWSLQELRFEKIRVLTRARPLFADVAVPAGVAYKGPRLGTPGNDKFYWRGAAVG